MHRLWPLLLLFLLQPRTAAAEVLSYGYMAYVAPAAARAQPARPKQQMQPADAMEPGAHLRCPGERIDRVPPEAGARAAVRPRGPYPAPLRRASAGLDAGPCSPHCERLPYDATAPPLPQIPTL